MVGEDTNQGTEEIIDLFIWSVKTPTKEAKKK